MTLLLNRSCDVSNTHRSSPKAGPAKRGRWCDDPRLLSLLGGGPGVLGPQAVEQRFDDAHLGTVKAGDIVALSWLVIVAGSADVLIEETDTGHVLTGRRGANNDCRLIFRHAYGRVRCELSTVSGAADAHIGFLDHRSFAEVQTFSISHPRGQRGDARGSLWTRLEYRSEPLCELQGIVWRGGLLQITSLELTP